MSGELELQPRGDIRMMRDPEAVLNDAKKAAKAVMEIIKSKENPVKFNGQTYLEFEDWQTLGHFYGITAKPTGSIFVDYGSVKGFEAGADAIGPDGRVLSHADSMCLNDEENWSTRPKYEFEHELDENGKKIWVEGKNGKKGYYKGTKKKIADVPVPMFQLKSMAQTRASAKCLRNVLAWIVVLVGLPPTPAEEMTGTENTDKASAEQAVHEKPKIDPETLKGHPFKEMPAKFDGDCGVCPKPVKKGDTILYSNQLKKAFHPDCLNPPKQEKKPEIDRNAPAPKGILTNLQKLAEKAGVKLFDRIGRDGHENLEELTVGYANDLLSEFADIIDQKQAEPK